MTSSLGGKPRGLAGKVAIVTGGGRGIGRAIAGALAEDGAAVTVAARSKNEIAAAAFEITSHGGRALAARVDVTSAAEVSWMVAETERQLGPVNILVNNAGVPGTAGPFWETDPDVWWRTIEVNLRGPALCSHAVLPGMIVRRHGTIVNVGSNAGIRRMDTYSEYATSKAALLRFTDGLASALAVHNVSVFAIGPGTVRTAMAASLPEYKDFPDEEWDPVERAAQLVVRLAKGDANTLSGCYLHIEDDLDSLIREAKRIQREGLYILRLLKIGGPEE